uniref:Uncharacterized protein n=1 Tax=viral metagenome TaxID=1070528 RepID=A0A6C0M2N5_9ZZZZ
MVIELQKLRVQVVYVGDEQKMLHSLITLRQKHGIGGAVGHHGSIVTLHGKRAGVLVGHWVIYIKKVPCIFFFNFLYNQFIDYINKRVSL